MCQSPKECLLQLESIFALGISITGLQSSASLIMDSHMALLTHTVLRFFFSPLIPQFVYFPLTFWHSKSVSSTLFFVIYYLFVHILFFYKHALSLSVLYKRLDTTHHTEVWPKLPWQHRLGCPVFVDCSFHQVTENTEHCMTGCKWSTDIEGNAFSSKSICSVCVENVNTDIGVFFPFSFFLHWAENVLYSH